jgi:hypothetical protein
VQDPFDDGVAAVVQNEADGVRNERRCEAARLVVLPQDDAAQVVLLDLTDQGWWRSRS